MALHERQLVAFVRGHARWLDSKELFLMVADYAHTSGWSEYLAEGNGAGAVRLGSRYRPISSQIALSARVTVIIPAKNEAENLPHVFGTLPGWIDEIVLVDGRSADDTVAVAQRLRPDIKVVRQVGIGKGDALLAGFAASTGDIIVTMDADGSTDGSEIVRFVAALAAGADFVKGSRFANGGGSADLTTMRRFGNRVLGAMVNWLFGTKYTDLCYGYNAFWARHLGSLSLDCEGFEVETLMNIRAAEAGLRVHEVPSFEHRRLHGSSNLHIFADGRRIAKVILMEWHRRLRAQRALAFQGAAREALPAPTVAPLHEVASAAQLTSQNGTKAAQDDPAI